jgi:hypothetical protein
MRAADGVVTVFRIPSRGIAFDVDVGPDEHGRQVAVYSRCAREPVPYAGGGLSLYRTGGRCRLYELQLASGRERRLRTPTERSGSDFSPTIWRGRLAWAHATDKTVAIMVKEGGKTRRLRAGTPSNERLSGVPSSGVRGLDLRGSRLSLVWSYYNRCARDDPYGLRPEVYELWSYRLGHSRHRVARAGCPRDRDSGITWAQLTRSGLTYSAVSMSNADILVGPRGRTRLDLPLGTFVQSFARLDNGSLATAHDGSGNGLTIG